MSTNVEKSTQPQTSESNDLITTLPPLTQRFIHLYMTGQYSLAKIAQLLEVHPNTIGNWLKRKDVREVIDEMQAQNHEMVSTQLKASTVKAIQKLQQLMDSPIDGVALQAVKDVLDRAGHKQKQEIKIDKTVTTVEQKMAQLIDSTIVEGEFEEVDEDS
jgi:IS30 family transposase